MEFKGSLLFRSRRSPVVSLNGCVSSSQPHASRVGVDILKEGGNAADAAVAVAAALNVTEPVSTGIGGDCFCLFYSAKDRRVYAVNGSGRSPFALNLSLLAQQGYSETKPLPPFHAHNVTVPGAAAGWVDTIEKFGSGKLSLAEVLAPAIQLAEDGVPISPLSAYFWEKGTFQLLKDGNPHGCDLLLDGKAPAAGDVMKMPHLANTFKELATKGKDGFYKGRIAQALVDIIKANGGVMSSEDLERHESTFDDPIHVNYHGTDVWEIPPNGQGITALIALNILEGFDIKAMGHNSAEHLHHLIEALRLSFADTAWYVADPARQSVPIKQLLDKSYAKKRRQLISPNQAMEKCERGQLFSSSDTVYFSVVDGDGNACSFINSNYMGFGTGLVPAGCGFTLQNRGANFSLNPSHPNCLDGNKRPYHTIIPGMATRADNQELFACFGVMGGFMQPQGHVQVLTNMVDFGMDPQEALDAPRICIGSGYSSDDVVISAEDGIAEETCDALRRLGHTIQSNVSDYYRALFGRGQIIRPCTARGSERPVLWAGSDGRADGLAIGY